MTVQNQNVKNVYRGNGSATVFPFTFAINKEHLEYIHVYITDDGGKAVETTDFACDMDAKTITYPKTTSSAAKLSSTQRLTIYRLLPYTQELNLVNQGPFFAEDVETELDDLEMQIQQQKEESGRSLQVGLEVESFDTTIPIEAGKTIRVNDEGDGFESVNDMLMSDGAWDAKGAVIKNVGAPVSVGDATNKNYVDAVVAAVAHANGKIFSLRNVAEMRSAKLVANVYALTGGYYSPNDNGAGVYYIRAAAPGDVDDAGSIIVLDNGNVAELIHNGTVNVKQFGAKGDGVTDDVTAINNAVNFTKASRIIFPKATFALNSEIIFQRGNVTIVGNKVALFCLSTFASTHVIWLRNNTSQMHNIVIDGLEINGNKANITNRVAGILAGSSATDPITDITIKSCYIHGLTGNGIHLDGYTIDNNPVQRGSRLLVDGCNIQNTRLAICQSGVSTTIRNCNLNNSDLENITVDNGCRNCEILNNTIGVHYGGAGNISTDGSDQTRIIGNRIDNGNDSTAPTALSNGITFNANTGPCNFCVVSDNLILGNAKYGIWIKDKVADGKHIGCGYTTITGNVFTSNVEKDIQIDNVNGSGNTNLVIADNRYTTEEAIGINETNYKRIHSKTVFGASVRNASTNPLINIKSIMRRLMMSDTKLNIKLIGDSITQGAGGTGIDAAGALIFGNHYVNVGGHCWANSLKAYLESKFNCEVFNYGCGGITSGVAVQNISSLIKDNDDIVICMLGTNDRNNITDPVSGNPQSTTTLYNNLKTIYQYCRERGSDIIFMACVPSSQANEQLNKNFHMNDVDHTIMKLASDLNMEYISVYKLFSRYIASQGFTLGDVLADGLHPNDTGYDIMSYLITDALGFGNSLDSVEGQPTLITEEAITFTKEANVDIFQYAGFKIGKYAVVTLRFSFSSLDAQGWTKVCEGAMFPINSVYFAFVSAPTAITRDGQWNQSSKGVYIWVQTTDINKTFCATFVAKVK